MQNVCIQTSRSASINNVSTSVSSRSLSGNAISVNNISSERNGGECMTKVRKELVEYMDIDTYIWPALSVFDGYALEYSMMNGTE